VDSDIGKVESHLLAIHAEAEIVLDKECCALGRYIL
jgi:hypothetical protein